MKVCQVRLANVCDLTLGRPRQVDCCGLSFVCKRNSRPLRVDYRVRVLLRKQRERKGAEANITLKATKAI